MTPQQLWLRVTDVPSYLDAHCKHQTRLREQREGLVVGHVFAIVPHGVLQGGVGDEEEQQRAVAAVESTLEEGPLAEVQVPLTRNVELRVLEAPAAAHILTAQEEQDGF